MPLLDKNGNCIYIYTGQYNSVFASAGSAYGGVRPLGLTSQKIKLLRTEFGKLQNLVTAGYTVATNFRVLLWIVCVTALYA
jgi:hypothetical protein